MIDLSTKYLGLTLKNPVIAASSGLTSTISNIKKLEANGAAAVVLKSIFEEEILQQEVMQTREAEANSMIYSELSETLDYIDLHIKEDTINKYLDLIRQAKKETLIPIIASINCTTDYEWIEFAQKIENAGADALELNIFLSPTDLSERNFEQAYLDIAGKVIGKTGIPVSVKISPYFTKLSRVIADLSKTGVRGLVLFNRFYSPDIDLDKMEIVSANHFSRENEYLNSLRWIALMSKKVTSDLVASTGIHSAETIVKQILVGASAVQVASVLYEKGVDYLSVLLADLEKWMEDKRYTHLGQLKGKLSQESVTDPAAYERRQFMKYFSGIE
ncbi:MAG: dihydroorotate dehydrogenase-like protein [Bacteroidales bacterium]|nr:dihydroorotate dehydrogenase-like protein [Bacteroidales bacterium]